MTPKDTRTKLLDAALTVVRTKGYAATSVEDLCRAAGVTKGAFFHHFRSKEDLGIAAAGHFGDMAESLFSGAGYRDLDDPLARLLGYIDLRRAILVGDIANYTCLFGTLVQETWNSHPALRTACEAQITGHAALLEPDIAALMRREGLAGWTPRSLALHIQAVLQGAFILAKATGGAEVAIDSLEHLRRYLTLLFDARPDPEGRIAIRPETGKGEIWT